MKSFKSEGNVALQDLTPDAVTPDAVDPDGQEESWVASI